MKKVCSRAFLAIMLAISLVPSIAFATVGGFKEVSFGADSILVPTKDVSADGLVLNHSTREDLGTFDPAVAIPLHTVEFVNSHNSETTIYISRNSVFDISADESEGSSVVAQTIKDTKSSYAAKFTMKPGAKASFTFTLKPGLALGIYEEAIVLSDTDGHSVSYLPMVSLQKASSAIPGSTFEQVLNGKKQPVAKALGKKTSQVNTNAGMQAAKFVTLSSHANGSFKSSAYQQSEKETRANLINAGLWILGCSLLAAFVVAFAVRRENRKGKTKSI